MAKSADKLQRPDDSSRANLLKEEECFERILDIGKDTVGKIKPDSPVESNQNQIRSLRKTLKSISEIQREFGELVISGNKIIAAQRQAKPKPKPTNGQWRKTPNGVFLFMDGWEPYTGDVSKLDPKNELI